MRHLFAPLAIVLAAGVAPAAFAQDTLGAAISTALEHNPSMQAQRKVRAGADETLEQAKAAGRPNIGLSGSYGTQDVEVGRSFSVGGRTFPLDGRSERATAGVEVRQPLYAGGAIGAGTRQAQAGVQNAEAGLRGFQQQLILQVIGSYLDVRRAEAEVQIRDTNVSALRQQVQAATDRFNVGDVTRTDVAQAQSRAAGSEADLAAARSRLATARANYEEIVGRIPVQLAAPPTEPQTPGTIDAALSIAQADNPEIVAAKAAEKAAEEGVGVAKGKLRPKLDIVGSAGFIETYQDDTFRDTNVGVGAELKVPLYQGGLAASQTRGAKLNADRARFERMAVERSVSSQVNSAWYALIAAREALQASRSRVDAAAVALEGSQQELAVGTRITLDVLDQERELLDARLGLIDAERAVFLATSQLLAAIGRLSPDLFGR